MNGVLHHKLAVCTDNYTLIALLAAHGAIERSLFRHNRAGLAIRQRFHQIRLCRQSGDLRIAGKLVVSDKFRGERRID